MQRASVLSFIILFLSIAHSNSITINQNVAKCLSELATQQLTSSYNYLQLSAKFGSTNAYPGFASLFVKLSDEDSSKAHDIVKFIALRKAKIDRLISPNGVKIRTELTSVLDTVSGLGSARILNKEAWNTAMRCHQGANDANDANVQDYLESHVLEHHIEIDKLLSDFENRLAIAQASEKKLATYMLDEELLNTYGDRRKNIFS